MRNILHPRLSAGRIAEGPYGSTDAEAINGAFVLTERGVLLKIIAHDGEGSGWEHVSVSCPSRVPSWEEMCFVKDLFWRDDECVLQFHPPKQDYVNLHPNVLHLWRKRGENMSLPPRELI